MLIRCPSLFIQASTTLEQSAWPAATFSAHVLQEYPSRLIRWPLLCAVWTFAAGGILLKQFAFERFKVLQYSLYPILGWSLVVAAPVLLRHMTPVELSLLLAGG